MMSPLGGWHLQMRLRAVLRERTAMRLRLSWTVRPTLLGPGNHPATRSDQPALLMLEILAACAALHAKKLLVSIQCI